jgi:peroxiredoxin Q/BCP
VNDFPQTITTLLSGVLVALIFGAARAEDLAVGAPAPPFALPDQHGKSHRLADYQGRWVVLYFYPRDDTPGCTIEACNFRDDLPKLRALGTQILGLSMDDRQSHAAFAEKFSLPFPLLVDADGAVASHYGARWSIGPMKFVRRHTFIIDPQGKIARVYRDVNPETHSQQVLQDLKALQP